MNKQHIAPQALLRAWPFPRGAGRILDKFFSDLRFDDDRVTVKTTDGFLLTVMPNELIGRHIYLTGEFDRTTVEVLTNFSMPDDVLLDVGANVGYVSGCFLQNVVESKVICVEPHPAVFDLLQKNMRQFARQRYEVIQAALSDRDDDGWIEINPRNLGESKLVDKPESNTIRINIKSVDTLVSSLKINRLDLVKIDVEGHEEAVFNSSKLHLRNLQPRAVFFEDHRGSCAPDECIGSLLDEIGYDVFGVKKHLTRVELLPITKKSECRYNDYIAVSRTREIPQRAINRYGLHSVPKPLS